MLTAIPFYSLHFFRHFILMFQAQRLFSAFLCMLPWVPLLVAVVWLNTQFQLQKFLLGLCKYWNSHCNESFVESTLHENFWLNWYSKYQIWYYECLIIMLKYTHCQNNLKGCLELAHLGIWQFVWHLFFIFLFFFLSEKKPGYSQEIIYLDTIFPPPLPV